MLIILGEIITIILLGVFGLGTVITACYLIETTIDNIKRGNLK